MTWTATPPAEPGYYWARWKSHMHMIDLVVRVFAINSRGTLKLWIHGTNAYHELSDVQLWGGPIQPPTEQGEGNIPPGQEKDLAFDEWLTRIPGGTP
jgi:hypothetical protein